MDIEITYHIREVREERNVSLRELSEKSGVSKSAINFIENGQREPTLRTLCLLSLALDVSPSRLFSMEKKQ